MKSTARTLTAALLTVPVLFMSSQSAPAAAVGLVIENAGTPALRICRDWNYPVGTNTASTCKDSPTGVLYKGQKSTTKYEWPDTDAVRLTIGYRLKERITLTIKGDTIYEYITLTGCAKSNYWKKMQPVATRTERDLYLKKC